MKRVAAVLLAGSLAAGCAMLEPEPCTAEWVDWKTERIIGEFVFSHTDQFEDARNFGRLVDGMGELGKDDIPMMLLTASGVLEIALDFGKEAWPEAEAALAECATSPRSFQLFAGMMRDQGVDERAIRAIEKLGTLLDK